MKGFVKNKSYQTKTSMKKADRILLFHERISSAKKVLEKGLSPEEKFVSHVYEGEIPTKEHECFYLLFIAYAPEELPLKNLHEDAKDVVAIESVQRLFQWEQNFHH